MGKSTHILQDIQNRYEEFKGTTFISDKKSFTKFISDNCPNFAHRGPKEYPCLVEAVSGKGSDSPRRSGEGFG